MQTESSMERDAILLREAIALAREHSQMRAGGPFGAVIARDGTIIGRGWNRVTSANDPTAHAEIVAIRDACRAANAFHLHDCVLYTSCEPCPMCLIAACWARLTRIVYAADRNDAAAIGFDDAHLYTQISAPDECVDLVRTQLLRNEAVAVMRAWEMLPGKIVY
jgi:guanine deaminase